MKRIYACKTTVLLLLVLTLTAGLLGATLVCGASAFAEQPNSDFTVTLDADSTFAAYGERFCYSLGNTLYVGIDNQLISLPDAWSGKITHLAMSDKHILARNDAQELFWFAYHANEVQQINASEHFPKLFGDLQNKPMLALSSSTNGVFYLLCATQNEIVYFDLSIGDQPLRTVYHCDGNLFDFSSWTIRQFSETSSDDPNKPFSELYAVNNPDSVMYRINKNTRLQSLAEFETDVKNIGITSIAAATDYVYLNTANGLQCYNPENGQLMPLQADIVPDASAQLYATQSYLYAFCPAQSAIRQYVLQSDGSIRYINSFDNTVYTNPDTYTDLRLIRTTEGLDAFISPKNLRFAFHVEAGTCLLRLQSVTFGTRVFCYVTDGKGNYGYIPDDGSAPVQEVTATDNTPLGRNAMPLHPNSKLYRYPLAESEQIAEPGIAQTLVVLDNVGGAGSSEWGWYHVSYLVDGLRVSGYMRATDLAPFTMLSAPDTRITAKIATAQFGTVVKAYELPGADSKVVAEFVDGSRVTLAETYNPDSEWTCIVLEDGYAYVPTAALQIGGLTGVQIAVIVIVSALAAATVCVVIVLVVRKRKSRRSQTIIPYRSDADNGTY